MKKIILSILTALALLAGGLGFAAPATSVEAGTQDYGTYVWYGTCGGTGSCNGWHIRVWSMNGVEDRLLIGDTQRNVAKVCPADHQHRISYWRPDGSYVPVKGYGECQDMRFAAEGTYRFGQQD